MLTAIFTELGTIIAALAGIIVSVFTDVIELFYVSPTGLTVLGSLLLIPVGLSFVMFGFKFIVKLVGSIRAKG
jgi:hypothetical protein